MPRDPNAVKLEHYRRGGDGAPFAAERAILRCAAKWVVTPFLIALAKRGDR